MSGTVSTRWFFSDWKSDAGVQASSLAARGLWKELLCIAGGNKAKEHGYVLIGGRKPTNAEIAKLVGATVEEVDALLPELERNRVFNRDRRGVIYCRRMVRAEKYRENGEGSARVGRVPKPKRSKENTEAPPLPLPEPEPGPSVKKGKSRAKARAALADDWKPSEIDHRYARNHGFSIPEVDRMAEAFANHHRSRGNLMADWAAAWRTWVLNEIKFNARGSKPAKAPRPATAMDARRAMKNFNRAEDDHGNGDDEDTEHRRALPARGS